jgi:hypothetical protein
MTIKLLMFNIGLLYIFSTPVVAQYPGWQHEGIMYILTTPEGANLPAEALEHDFPLLVRLDKGTFDFSKAKVNGEDIRFSGGNNALVYQVEEWNAEKGTASIWVKIPEIQGNARQEIKMFWGNSEAKSESNGKAVFNESNGYLSVWHMNGPLKDEVGTLESKDIGTTSSLGIIGNSRHFSEGNGINCGENITSFPTGSSPHTSEAWFRAEKPNAIILAWGNEEPQGKVIMQFVSPAHLKIDSYFSDADVVSVGNLSPAKWVYAVHTYQKGDSRIYVNGILDGTSIIFEEQQAKKKTGRGSALSIKNPARMAIGGWYNNYNFMGDIDEVRISKVVRSADWIKLQYENQKSMQTLAGPLVQPGNQFSVSEKKITILEGKSAYITASAGGAQKLYWILNANGKETVLAVDQYLFKLDAGRVVGNKSFTLRLKAVYPNRVKTIDIPVTIKEDIPEPVFSLNARSSWDGRTPFNIVPQIANLKQMQAKGAGNLMYTWKISDIAVTKEIVPGKLILKRSQNSGRMTVTTTVSNGGQPKTHSVQLIVNEPKKDAWIQRIPGKDEQPEDNQFYARDDNNEGKLYYNGKLPGPANFVFLKVYADDKIYKTESQQPASDLSYAFTVNLKPGLIRYKVEFGIKNKGKETILRSVNNLLCGDAYLITGQSNALATSWGDEDFWETSEWIRSYGSPGNDPKSVSWGMPMRRSNNDSLTIGYWGFELARHLVESQKIPICIINGAVGGTRIDEHQRNIENPRDLNTIYGRLLFRVNQARLTHSIRGIFWHQGENDQGADGPDGGFGWEKYKDYFINLAAAWKQDYPNVQHYYMFQIWPKSCAMGINGSDNILREVQRTLPKYFSNLSIMSTLGIKPAGTCHFSPEGYAEFARLIWPLVERDNYGKFFTKSITPPDIKKAYYKSNQKDRIVLEFDQPVVWSDSLKDQFYFDGKNGMILSGTASANTIIVKLKKPSTSKKITYLDSKSWSQDKLLYGENGIAALTFWDVPILTLKTGKSMN